MRLIHGDCLDEMPQLIKEGVEVDLILTDPPYGTIKNMPLDGWNEKSTYWDKIIKPGLMFKYCEKLLKIKGKLILFSQEPYTSFLRTYKVENMAFNYPLIWKKDHFANNLSCKKAPVSYFEDLTVWSKLHDSNLKHPLRDYAKQLLESLGVTYKDIYEYFGHSKAEHFLGRLNSSQFNLCTEETYEELILEFHIDELDCFKPYNELEEVNKGRGGKSTFNLEGNYKGNILEFKKSYNHFHPTEKPVDLLEDLIKTYTNPGDTVLDFTMGSGSTGVACAETNRDFIGIELKEEYFNMAEKRINEAKKQQRLV